MLTSQHSPQRLEHLYEISRLLITFESIEKTLDRALAISAETLPLASAVLIEERDGHSRMIFWASEGLAEDRLSAAKSNAELMFRYLAGVEPLDLLHQPGRTELRPPVVLPSDSVDRKRFIVLPLVVAGRPPFGVLQLEGAGPLDEADLVFVNLIANQLALALDRHHAWQRDITGRKRAEDRQAGAELKEAAADRRRLTAEALMDRYQALVDNLARAIVWEADADSFRVSYVSRRAEALLGHPRDSWLEPTWWRDHVHPDDLERVLETFDRVRWGNGDQRCEHRCITRDGRVVWFHTGVHLAFGDTDSPQLQGVSVDITSEKRAEEELRDQLEFTRSMAASLGEGVVAIDLEGKVTFFNDAARTMLGVIEGGADAKALGLEPFFESVIRSGLTIRGEDHRFISAAGESLVVSYTVAPIVRGGRLTGAVLVFRDIAERVQAEDARRFLLESSNALAATLVDRSLLETLVHIGIPRLADVCVFDEVADDGRLSRAAVAPTDGDQREHLDVLPIELAAQALAAGEPIIASGERGSRMTVPITMGDRKLGALTFLFADSTRRHSPADLALAEELTRRAAFALENARLYQDERRAVRMREQVLGVVSHDLKNPLSSIMFATSVLASKASGELQPVIASTVARIQRAAEQMKRLIEDLLDLASIQAGRFAIQRRPQDPASMLQEALAGFEAIALEKRVRLCAEVDPDLPSVLCDRDRVLQVISNLVGNALKVTEDGVVFARVVRGEEVVFAISDTGPGIKQDDLAHLFERYWRSSDVEYKGTGLGLAIARGIVEAHGGRIWAESTLGEGATFFFTLPSYGARSDAASSQSSQL